jgi:hypothetical protein
MENDPKKQRIYLNIGKNCEEKVLDYDFLKPLIKYFEFKGWKFKIRFDDSVDIFKGIAYFEKEFAEVKKK